MSNLLNERFLDMKGVKELTTLSRPTIYAYVKDPRQNFPKPITIGLRRVVWLKSECDAWLAAKIRAARRAA
jgi:predicted DNA-binding transcriptional regulator AlpA